MDAPDHRRGWLLMSTEGGSLYDDRLGIEYPYDSNVQNYKRLKQGDPIALWDGEQLLGISVIERITSEAGMKTMYRCPECGRTRPNPPSTRNPQFRCSRPTCRKSFDTPVVETVEVTRYAAVYDAGWTSLDSLVNRDEIRPFLIKSASFNAIREIDWTAFENLLAAKGARRALGRIAARVPDLSYPLPTEPQIELAHGFNQSIVRVRRGQREFRRHILASQGSRCAFTGDAPPNALEAGHLYSYAQLGEHVEYGGLMLRRDIHRLFDDGLLSVEPTRLRIDVAPDLSTYPQYAALHDRELTTELRTGQAEWLDRHWREHREEHGFHRA